MEVLLLLIRIFLFAILAAAGIGKFSDLSGSEKAVKEFGVPEKLAKTVSIALPSAELFFAFLLLLTTTSWFGAAGTFLLLAVFTGGMIRQLARGNAPDCHCFGAIHSEPVSVRSLIRNLIIAAFALFLIARGWNAQGLSFSDLTNEFALQLIFGLAITGLFGAAIYYLKKISEQQTQILRRIEIIEVISHEGVEVEREDVSYPSAGLPVGSPAPDFVLPNLSGKEISFENLLMNARPLVFFFVSPSCSPCGALLPEIETWQKNLKDKIEIVFISSGKTEENAEKFGGQSFKQILLQKDKETAALFGAIWTPGAILINADGTVASHLATGDAAIQELFSEITVASVEEGMIYIKNDDGSKHLGEKVPDFVVSDVDGKTVSTENLLGKKTLLTYWGLDCGWCGLMLADLREWDQKRGLDEPDLLVVSAGDAQRNRNLGLRGKILLDDEKNLPNSLGMTGTPSAVLIDEDGRVVSEVAVGAENIWSLIGKK